jgi:uncharacterized protein
MMSLQLLERTMRQAIEGQNTPRYVFSWQGGEPTLAGIGFFEEALRLQRELAPESAEIVNEIQTNGLELDNDWCDLFRKHNFRVALSADGPPASHDAFRRDRDGQGTSRQTLGSALLLHQRQVPLTALVAVHRMSVRDPLAVYEYARDRLRAKAIHFIPILERRDAGEVAPGHWDLRSRKVLGSNQLRPGKTNLLTDWSVDFEMYGEFLKQVFDIWRDGDVGEISIPLFDSLLAQWLDEPTRFCEMGETCGSSLVVDWDGTVYSCPVFLYPEYAIGNIRDEDLGELAAGPEQTAFGVAKADVCSDCESCEFFFACHGGCPRRRYAKTQKGQAIDMLCPSLLEFNRYVGPYFRVFARSVRENA